MRENIHGPTSLFSHPFPYPHQNIMSRVWAGVWVVLAIGIIFLIAGLICAQVYRVKGIPPWVYLITVFGIVCIILAIFILLFQTISDTSGCTKKAVCGGSFSTSDPSSHSRYSPSLITDLLPPGVTPKDLATISSSYRPPNVPTMPNIIPVVV